MVIRRKYNSTKRYLARDAVRWGLTLPKGSIRREVRVRKHGPENAFPRFLAPIGSSARPLPAFQMREATQMARRKRPTRPCPWGGAQRGHGHSWWISDIPVTAKPGRERTVRYGASTAKELPFARPQPLTATDPCGALGSSCRWPPKPTFCFVQSMECTDAAFRLFACKVVAACMGEFHAVCAFGLPRLSCMK
jgi:hypothetical protein